MTATDEYDSASKSRVDLARTAQPPSPSPPSRRRRRRDRRRSRSTSTPRHRATRTARSRRTSGTSATPRSATGEKTTHTYTSPSADPADCDADGHRRPGRHRDRDPAGHANRRADRAGCERRPARGRADRRARRARQRRGPRRRCDHGVRQHPGSPWHRQLRPARRLHVHGRPPASRAPTSSPTRYATRPGARRRRRSPSPLARRPAAGAPGRPQRPRVHTPRDQGDLRRAGQRRRHPAADLGRCHPTGARHGDLLSRRPVLLRAGSGLLGQRRLPLHDQEQRRPALHGRGARHRGTAERGLRSLGVRLARPGDQRPRRELGRRRRGRAGGRGRRRARRSSHVRRSRPR